MNEIEEGKKMADEQFDKIAGMLIKQTGKLNFEPSNFHPSSNIDDLFQWQYYLKNDCRCEIDTRCEKDEKGVITEVRVTIIMPIDSYYQHSYIGINQAVFKHDKARFVGIDANSSRSFILASKIYIAYNMDKENFKIPE